MFNVSKFLLIQHIRFARRISGISEELANQNRPKNNKFLILN